MTNQNKIIPSDDLKKFKSEKELLAFAKKLEGKTLSEITTDIADDDFKSRVTTKGNVGYVIEKGVFGINKNSLAEPDIAYLDVELKTCPLKHTKNNKLTVKEPLSLNIINYCEEYKHTIEESSLYKKNKKILFFCYIHDNSKNRSEYTIKYVFLWKMTSAVLDELRPDYNKIIDKIKSGNAHNIHQKEHQYLTLCPKHSGVYKDPNCHKSKVSQPFSSVKGEVRAFRFKNKYMNLIITRELNKRLEKGGWADN